MVKESRELHCISQSREFGEDLHQARPRSLGQSRLHLLLGTLPPRQQEVLQLKFQNDLSYQQISEITELSVSNVGVLIHNALKTLRQRYGQASKDFLPFTPRIVS